MILNPCDEAYKEERVQKVINHEQGADCAELWECPSIEIEHTFHKGKLVVLVFLPVGKDILIESICLVAGPKTLRQNSILLNANRLGQATVHKWLGVAISNLLP